MNIHEIRLALIDIYTEFYNNYLTIEKFAEHHGLPVNLAQAVIDAGKYISSGNHPEE